MARLLFGSAMMLLTCLGGCNIVGPASYIIAGTGDVDAEYVLPDVPTVVFVDDRANVVNPVSLRRVIADKVSQDLMTKKILTTTISPQDAMAVAKQQERANQIMSIEDIGKAVGAKQVIYLQMIAFKDTPDGTTPRPVGACRVKVIDVDKRERTYPASGAREDARTVQVSGRPVDPDTYSTRTGRVSVFNELALTMGRDVGWLFYKHEPRAPGQNITPR
jgi:hypothetical protein